MKKILIATLLVFVVLAAKAQYNYSPWGVGASFGTLKPYSDTRQNDDTKGGSISLYWNYSPYLPVALEVMKGTLSGGNNETDPYHRYWKNEYTAFNLHLDLQAGEVIDYDGNFFLKALAGFYTGVGVGGMINNITSIRRYDLLQPTYKFPGNDHSFSLLVPMRFGYELKFYNYDDEPFLMLDVGYTHYLTFSEGLDGYADPDNHFKNNAQDMFRSIYVGLKFNFGTSISYIKAIH